MNANTSGAPTLALSHAEAALMQRRNPVRALLRFARQRAVDTVQSVPALVLLISILVVLGASLTNVIIALAVRGAVTQSRVVRGSVLGIKSATYVEGARVVGCSQLRVILRYIVPNIFP